VIEEGNNELQVATDIEKGPHAQFQAQLSVPSVYCVVRDVHHMGIHHILSQSAGPDIFSSSSTSTSV
jgi:hypothetical protein